MSQLIEYFPKPFLDDLVMGRYMPFIGAGFSKNAKIPNNATMPDWDHLGREISKSLANHRYSTPTEAISTYVHRFMTVSFVEELIRLLHIGDAQPGEAHLAFSKLPFDLIVTTNFDFLLEKSYQDLNRYCSPLINEEQLAIGSAGSGVRLLKLHGDVHHPERLVATEDDYSGFLSRYPLLATFITYLLIANTVLFIGYSLDDPDLRQIWQVAKDRLGGIRRPAYSLQVDAGSDVVERFGRRGVIVINLPKLPRKNYGQILAQAFDELRAYWSDQLIELSTTVRHEPSAEFKLPSDLPSRLCFFMVPNQLAGFYEETLYPIAESYGFVPIMAREVYSPGDSQFAKVSALIDRAKLIIADVSSPTVAKELSVGISTRGQDSDRLLIISSTEGPVPDEFRNYSSIKRPAEVYKDVESFQDSVDEWFGSVAEELQPKFDYKEPQRLLDKKEYRAAVISSISVLETELRQALEKSDRISDDSPNPAPRKMIDMALEAGFINSSEHVTLLQDLARRNQIVHEGKPVRWNTARKIVNEVSEISSKLREIRDQVAEKEQ